MTIFMFVRLWFTTVIDRFLDLSFSFTQIQTGPTGKNHVHKYFTSNTVILHYPNNTLFEEKLHSRYCCTTIFNNLPNHIRNEPSLSRLKRCACNYFFYKTALGRRCSGFTKMLLRDVMLRVGRTRQPYCTYSPLERC